MVDGQRKVKGTLHWVSCKHAINGTINIYDRLFNTPNPAVYIKGNELSKVMNPNSIEIIKNAKLESNLQNSSLHEKYQFLRKGYFVCDKNSNHDNLVFNQIVGLRDAWSKKTSE